MTVLITEVARPGTTRPRGGELRLRSSEGATRATAPPVVVGRDHLVDERAEQRAGRIIDPLNVAEMAANLHGDACLQLGSGRQPLDVLYRPLLGILHPGG